MNPLYLVGIQVGLFISVMGYIIICSVKKNNEEYLVYRVHGEKNEKD